jgi:hypothetical protein
VPDEPGKDVAVNADESEWDISVIRLPDEPEVDAGVGVREPRHPKPSSLFGASALPRPDSDEDA